MSRKLLDAMQWQIYQAYMSGPHALFELFEQAFGRRALCGTEETDQQQREIDGLSEQIARLRAQIQKLQAEARELQHRSFRLGHRNQELEALVSKDSHNSSRPPSTESTLGQADTEPAPSLGQKRERASGTPWRDARVVSTPASRR